MINKKENRLRRAGATRARIKLQKVNRLTVHRTNLHIYASIISASGDRVLVSASTELLTFAALSGKFSFAGRHDLLPGHAGVVAADMDDRRIGFGG